MCDTVAGMRTSNEGVICESIILLITKPRFFDLEALASGCFVGEWPVITLHEILIQNLPVGPPSELLVYDRNICLDSITLDERMERLDHLRNRGRLRIERYVNPAIPDFGSNAMQANLVPTKSFSCLHVRSGDELTSFIVGPGVIGAYNAPQIAATLEKDHLPVSTNIRKAPDLPI